MENVVNSLILELDKKYARLYNWYVLELEPFVRSNTDASLTLEEGHCPIIPIKDFCGHTLWSQAYEIEKKQILTKHEKYTCEKHGYDINDKHMWIGINPDKKIITDMKTLYDIIKSSRIFKKWKYELVIEAHTKECYRPHIHMILYEDIRPNRLIQTFSKLFKCDSNYIDAKTSYSLSVHQNYVRGIKTEEKLEFVELDNQERTKHNIPHHIVRT